MVWHGRLRRDLSEHVDGRLSARRRARLTRHLTHCAACRREIRELERTVALLRSLPRPELSPEASARLVARVAARSAQPPAAALRAARLLAPVAAAAAAVALLTVVQGVEISVVLPGFGSGETSRPAAAPARPAPEAVAPVVRGPRAAFRVAEGNVVGRAALGPGAAAEPHPAPSRARSLERPLPPLAACATPAGAAEQACARWHSWLVGLAMRDPSAFVVEVESLPSGVRERWLGEMSRFAAHAGAASLLAAELRATGDPRASSLAHRFERTTTVVSRR